jgi:peptidoglycan/LPS O-acetylase OafA/YrhL
MSQGGRITYIDAWRFIAVSLVIFAHMVVFSGFSFLVVMYPFLRRLDRFGVLGVLIFFFISGFVICRGLIKEKNEHGRLSLRAFYVRRSLRILPPLWLYMVTLAVFAQSDLIKLSAEKFLYSGLFLSNFDFYVGWYLGHTWSLSYEEQFYLAFPLLFSVFGLTQRRTLALVTVFACMLLSVEQRLSGNNLPADYLMYLLYLLSGCVAALYEHRISALMSCVSFVQWLTLATVFVVSFMLVPHPFELYAQATLYPLLVATLVLATPLHRPRIRSFFHHPLVVQSGRISYTVYLWQQLATATWPGLNASWTLLFILAVWLLAYVSWHLIETPLIRMGAKWSDAILSRSRSGQVPVTK